jgi:hypothetical protein
MVRSYTNDVVLPFVAADDEADDDVDETEHGDDEFPELSEEEDVSEYGGFDTDDES